MRDPRELRWSKRKQVVAYEILRTQPDLIGLQEVMDIQFREYETGRVFWVFNTHFSHRFDDDAERRRVSQAKVLHQFISDRARRYRICDASFYNEGELVTTQDIAIPFLEPVIVTGDFNSAQGESGAWDMPFGILTKPLVDDVGGRPTGFFTQLLPGATAFNTPFYGNPSKVPVLSRFSISNAYGTLESTGKIFAPQGDDLATMFESFWSYTGIDWILSNEGFSPLDFQVISRTHNASGRNYRNDNGEVVALSDVHDLMYASFIMTPDRSEQGQGVEIVTPRFFGKSYVGLAIPWSLVYNFDRVVVNGVCR